MFDKLCYGTNICHYPMQKSHYPMKIHTPDTTDHKYLSPVIMNQLKLSECLHVSPDTTSSRHPHITLTPTVDLTRLWINNCR